MHTPTSATLAFPSSSNTPSQILLRNYFFLGHARVKEGFYITRRFAKGFRAHPGALRSPQFGEA